jgi:hypothetical protein
MSDITAFPVERLLADRKESLEDLSFCERTMKPGVPECRWMKLKDRIEVNRRIIKRIDIELRRRRGMGA